MDARRQDQRHLRGHAADQPDDRRPAHPGLFLEGAVVAGLDLAPLLARVPDFREFLTLEELRAEARALVATFPGLARLETIGTSAEGRPIDLLTVGHGRRPALLVGVPHPNEPIGTLTLQFLCRLLCEDAELRARLDTTLYAIPVADPDGFVLNEGWFKGAFSPLRYALDYYRPPHREQVEWSFPVEYKTLRFTTPAPETAVLMRVMERVRPAFFYSLHNAGFCGVYFYVSRDRPELYEGLHRLVAEQGLPLHRGEPEVPYLRTLAPAVYRLFGIDEAYDYYAATLDGDPAALIEAGTSSDDWLRHVSDAFSLVCELPYYTAPALEDLRPAGSTRREAVLAGVARAEAVHAECAASFAKIAARVPDHRLLRSVRDYLAKAQRRLAAERAHAAAAEYGREASRAEALDATVCKPFYHALYLGEVYRLAEMVSERALADALRARLVELTAQLERESDLVVLPLRPLVAVQAGAGLLALAAPD
ncbi:MAG: peptidase M14 [Deltaproteobacteria bacterium]|nr:MAG: peptidase M14 [Deltaproteobacteria bacterium]